MEKGKYPKYHDNIMYNGRNRRKGNAMFKTDGHIDNQNGKGKSYVQDGIPCYFWPNDRTNGFYTVDFRLPDFSADMAGNGLCFFRGQAAGTDNNFLARFFMSIPAELNDAALQAVLFKTGSDLSHGYWLRKF